MPIQLRKNAAPYWKLNYIKNKDLPGGKLEDTASWFDRVTLKHKKGMPNRIGRKLSEIRYTNSLKGDTCDLIFKTLTVAELDTIYFSKGVGYEVYLGWWDWFSTLKSSVRVFSGVVDLVSTDYTREGITVVMQLKHKGVIKAYAPAPSNLFKKENHIKEAVQTIAKYLGVKLAWGLKPNSPLSKNYHGDARKYNLPWVVSMTEKWYFFKSPGQPKAQGTYVEGRATISDILTNLTMKFGLTWYLRNNVLFFGSPENDPGDEVKKVFRYRSADRSIVGALNFTALEPFESFKVVDFQPVKADTTGMVLGDDKQMKGFQDEAKDYEQGHMSNDIQFYEQEEPSKVVTADKTEKALKIWEKKQHAKAQLARKKELAAYQSAANRVGGVGSKLSDPLLAAEAEKGKTKLSADNAVTCQVSGVLGDPTFGCFDKFAVYGVSTAQSHNGEYKCVKATHTFSLEGYTMDLIGTKRKDLLAQTIAAVEAQAAGNEAIAEKARKVKFYKTWSDIQAIPKDELNIKKNGQQGSGPKATTE